ncbi:hypothetical protein LIMNO130_50717 [Limnobacter sp. 130]|nr:hypothetical protein LIMNO130_50717 [Limnobacter sp. 130]
MLSYRAAEFSVNFTNKARAVCRSRAFLNATLPELNGHAFQHFDTDFTSSDFTQGGYCWLVFVGLYFGCVALGQHAGAVSGAQGHVETVRDLFQAIFNGDAGHLVSLQSNTFELRPVARHLLIETATGCEDDRFQL